MSQFRLFQSTKFPETNLSALSDEGQYEISMHIRALRSWDEVRDQVEQANPDLAEALGASHETLMENFGTDWIDQAPFVFVTNAPLPLVMKLLEFTEQRNKTNEEKLFFIASISAQNSLSMTPTDVQLLAEFSDILDRDIGHMPLTFLYSNFNKCAMPIVGCKGDEPTTPPSLLQSFINYFA